MTRFANTSGWAAWFDRREALHPKAVAVFDETWRRNGRVVTTNWVLDELTALLTSPLRIPKPTQIQFLADIRSDSGVEVVVIDSVLEAAAWRL